MRDCLEIGPCPTDEDCAQLGQEHYRESAKRECSVFIEQLRRTFGPEPDGAVLRIKANPHDFGTYYEVVCWYDDDNDAASTYAFRLEGETPAKWDDIARVELAPHRR